MDWSTLAPAIFSLLGVALGTAGSVLVAYYAHRSSREQQRRQIRTSLREERKQAIQEFLLEVERCWRFLDGYWERAPLVSVKGEPLPKELIELEAAQRSNELWYQQRKLALVTEQPIPELGLELTETIWQAIHRADRIKVSLYQHLHPAHEEFLEAANKYLTDETRF